MTPPTGRTPLERLIALGADLEATDAQGRTPLAIAMLKGDREAMRILRTAGARLPEPPATAPADVASLARTVQSVRPMLAVPDVNATVAWYQAVGFTLAGSHGEGGRLDWASVTLGGAEVMFVPAASGLPGWRGLSLWFDTDRIDDLYSELKRRQLLRSRRLLEGEPDESPEISFTSDLYTAFYGQREFGIRDPNGVELMFAQATNEVR
ncbi:MAG: VOC family protein [Gemmatimonadaceae bacterium]|nr:VOC family protein [Gemmatimonadaceae bacterium]